MTNLKEENKKQSSNIKEGTEIIADQQKQQIENITSTISEVTQPVTEVFLDEEKQQIENIASTISETTDQVTENINEYQEKNKEILDKSIDTANRYQQESINTIQSFSNHYINTIQSFSNNYIELQKNLLNTFHSVGSKFLDDALDKSYWNNFIYPERYTDIYNKTNQNITDKTVNATRRLNEFVLGSTENFNKSIEIAEKYYNESTQNYFNFVKKIGKSFSNQ
ncbi:MAG TPA: hypothetical protein VFP49_13600 [Nitrososphaeraceae archaeon]|nr:hypothetical protein [Nitrososphaeraceae archaeon]